VAPLSTQSIGLTIHPVASDATAVVVAGIVTAAIRLPI
jgi:hypothetical protein